MKFHVDESNHDVFDRSFEAALADLNQAVMASGAALEGNLFYPHHSTKHFEPRPAPGGAPKRGNFCNALQGKRQLLEIGFNAGHSALMACAANPDLHYTGVDISRHSYSQPCAEILAGLFPDHFTFYKGDSREVLPRLALEERRYDIFHVDGGHDPETARADLLDCLDLFDRSTPAHVLFDDTQLDELSAIFDEFCARGDLVVDDLDGEWLEADHVLARISDRVGQSRFGASSG